MGTVVLAAVGIILLLTVNDGDENRDPGWARRSAVPDPRLPDRRRAHRAAPARRGADRAVACASPGAADESQHGDTWQWTRTDTGEGGRTERASLRLQAPERVCVEVRLVRGQFSSPWSDECVD